MAVEQVGVGCGLEEANWSRSAKSVQLLLPAGGVGECSSEPARDQVVDVGFGPFKLDFVSLDRVWRQAEIGLGCADREWSDLGSKLGEVSVGPVLEVVCCSGELSVRPDDVQLAVKVERAPRHRGAGKDDASLTAFGDGDEGWSPAAPAESLGSV